MRIEDFDKVKDIIEKRNALKTTDKYLATLQDRDASVTRVQIGVVALNLPKTVCDRMLAVMREEIIRSIATLDCDLCDLDVDVGEDD
jgi:hypothetical protein